MSLTYYTAANPGMRYSGAFGYSKFSVIDQLDENFKPRTVLMRYYGDVSPVINQIEEDFEWPVIIKPDIGERGKNVERLEDVQAVKDYFKDMAYGDYIIQEYIDFPIELGVFYNKSLNGNAAITSVLMKKFLLMTGDGVSTMEQLIDADVRSYKRRDYLKQKYRSAVNNVIEKGVKLHLEPIGNHNRGTEFIDANHLIDQALVDVFEEIASRITGFHYGRFDLKVSSIEDLKKGENIRIFEVNGVNSEPGHIYDKNLSIMDAYRSVFEHMDIMYRISKENQRSGIKLAPPVRYYKDMYRYLVLNKV